MHAFGYDVGQQLSLSSRKTAAVLRQLRNSKLRRSRCTAHPHMLFARCPRTSLYQPTRFASALSNTPYATDYTEYYNVYSR
jgi:hypothetical protein